MQRNTPFAGHSRVEPTGIEPVTSCLQIGRKSKSMVTIGLQWPALLGRVGAAAIIGGGSFPFLLGPHLVPIPLPTPAENKP